MKTRFAIIGIVIVLAVSLLTCELDLPGKGSGDESEYTDWEYKIMPNGTAQLTLWLDGSKPVKATTDTRALGLEIAKRSHDYFEAVFIHDDVVARANWEIGQAAGIRGVPRGQDYVSCAAGSTTAAIIFVGRRVSEGVGTLLGVGNVTHVDGVSGETEIKAGSKSVTFTVSALDTNVGFDLSAEEIETGATGLADERGTFLTAAKDVPTGGGGGGTPFSAVSAANTDANIAVFKGGATYTLFGLPVDNDNNKDTPVANTGFEVKALYTIGGLDTLTPVASPASIPGIDYRAGILYYEDPDNEIVPAGEYIQVIERLAIYQILGTTYDVTEADLDTVTTVAYDAAAQPTAGTTFNHVIPLKFTIFPKSGGVFAFTFQIPVCALTFDASTNGGPGLTKWYVRPGHGTAQYRLDDGMASGGAVLMGVGVGAIDWLDIYVNGMGFTN